MNRCSGMVIVQSLKIILLCMASAVIYGICHDQVTTRVCVEYFTVGHAPIFHTESPTLLAFAWGTTATWWVGRSSASWLRWSPGQDRGRNSMPHI